MEDIAQAGDTYYKILHHQFNFYDTSSWKEFRNYTNKYRDKWEEVTDWTEQELREAYMNKVSTTTVIVIWNKKDPDNNRVVALLFFSEKPITYKTNTYDLTRSDCVEGNKTYIPRSN